MTVEASIIIVIINNSTRQPSTSNSEGNNNTAKRSHRLWWRWFSGRKCWAKQMVFVCLMYCCVFSLFDVCPLVCESVSVSLCVRIIIFGLIIFHTTAGGCNSTLTFLNIFHVQFSGYYVCICMFVYVYMCCCYHPVYPLLDNVDGFLLIPGPPFADPVSFFRYIPRPSSVCILPFSILLQLFPPRYSAFCH